MSRYQEIAALDIRKCTAAVLEELSSDRSPGIDSCLELHIFVYFYSFLGILLYPQDTLYTFLRQIVFAGQIFDAASRPVLLVNLSVAP